MEKIREEQKYNFSVSYSQQNYSGLLTIKNFDLKIINWKDSLKFTFIKNKGKLDPNILQLLNWYIENTCMNTQGMVDKLNSIITHLPQTDELFIEEDTNGIKTLTIILQGGDDKDSVHIGYWGRVIDFTLSRGNIDNILKVFNGDSKSDIAFKTIFNKVTSLEPRWRVINVRISLEHDNNHLLIVGEDKTIQAYTTMRHPPNFQKLTKFYLRKMGFQIEPDNAPDDYNEGVIQELKQLLNLVVEKQ